MPWARASSLTRILACPASVSLPVGRDTRSDDTKRKAEWGTAMHTVKETGRVPKEWRDNKHFVARAEYLNPKHWWPKHDGKHEVTYALCVLTWELQVYPETFDAGYELSRDAWKASRGPSYVVGTCDWDGDYFGELHVDDLKTGNHLPAVNGPPMLFYGLCASMRQGRPLKHLSLTHFPRYPKDTPAVRHWHEVEDNELDEFKTALQRAYLEYQRTSVRLYKIRSADVNPTPDGCAFCPAETNCPA